MAITDVAICNAALSRLSGESIQVVGEDNKEGRACGAQYPLARNFCLALYNWSFARRTLKLESEVASHPFGTVYKLPTDCIRPLRLLPEINGRRRWIPEGSTIVDPTRSEEDLYLLYTQEVVNTNLFSVAFSDLVILDLQVRLCPTISEDRKLLRDLQAELYTARSTHIGLDAVIGDDYPSNDHNTEYDPYVTPSGLSYDD
jgi:hypothetical protein